MAPETTCPRCGKSTLQASIHGLCAACLARGMDDLLNLTDEPPPDDLLPSIRGYQLDSPLGIGGMGQVFAATELATGNAVAVKILAPRWTADLEAEERFRTEAEALRLLEHPNIVQIQATGKTDDGRLYIAMELIVGCDLGRLLRAERLEPARAFDIFLKVAAALTHAHQRGIVHRDVKPSNILIGRDGTVKLADFGLAKHLADEHSHYGIGNLTQTRDTFGTPYYIAPEALRGRADASPAADIYAAGVLLYHLLTGSPPLGNFTRLSTFSGLPRKIDSVLDAAIQADPGKRSPDLHELIHCVESSQRGHSRRRPLLLISGVLASMVVTGTAWTLGWLSGRPKPPPPPLVFTNPTQASLLKPWKNSLGMSFVPLDPGKLLISVYETRRSEFEPYSLADRSQLPEWRLASQKMRRRLEHIETLTADGWKETNTTWKEPGFIQTPSEPASAIAQIDAELFCDWLTISESKEGRLQAPQRYRLPTEAEWLAAAGPTENADLPSNRAGQEVLALPWPTAWPVLSTSDPFPQTAPVGSFPAAPNGLYDMNGNVSEWTSSKSATRPLGGPANAAIIIRGSSWTTGTTRTPLRTARHLRATADVGFRCVLDLTGGSEGAAEEE